MAARQQQQQQQKIQYDDFVPNSESQDQSDSTLLLIHLPGFTREQIKVTYVHATRTLRVTGERPLAAAAAGEKRWSRFNKAFPVPENCHVDKIQGSFKNGVLTITMPKQTVSKVPQGSRSTERETKLPEASKASLETPREERKAKPEEKKVLEESRGRERVEQREESKPKEEKKTAEERLGEKKLREESKPEEEKKKLLQELKGKERITGALLEERRLGEEAKGEEGKEKKKLVPEVTQTKADASEAGEVRKGEGGYLLEKAKKEKGIMEKIWGKEVTSEEKKLMVNIGVAALVIFALGAYVSYTFSSSSSSSSSSSPSSSSSSASKPE